MLENVNLEIVICVTLALGYLAFNILHKKKFTVLLFVLTTLLYIIFHKIFTNEIYLIDRIPIIILISVVVSYIHQFIFSLDSDSDNSDESNEINLSLPVP